MHLLQVTTVGCIFLVFVLVSWLPQLGSSANIEGQADPSVRSTHVGLNELRARKRQNYRQVDYDYDEEENEEEEAEEELEAAINDTKSGGTEAEEVIYYITKLVTVLSAMNLFYP
ncbi:unnamed protein product [Ceratitis capitata]|uniref:(Mediterranean fruit fly) hypothetical protein n=1 Tax=Ceratitis capitata TaxID=7213 RepID=A0A811V4R9_CERCA|nr:unnamed protein product [Ceratitis capitata]